MRRCTWFLLVVGVSLCWASVSSTVSSQVEPDRSGRVDPAVVVAKSDPTAREIVIAVDLAKERMTPTEFRAYLDRFKGRKVSWKGLVYGVREREGGQWALACARCSAEALNNYDVIFLVPQGGTQRLKKGAAVVVSGTVSELAEPPRLRTLLGESGIGVKIVLDNVVLK